jgi:hypothetical protein
MSCRKYKSQNGQTRASECIRCGIKCLGNVTITIRTRHELYFQIQINGTNRSQDQTACGPKEGCMGKLLFCTKFDLNWPWFYRRRFLKIIPNLNLYKSGFQYCGPIRPPGTMI